MGIFLSVFLLGLRQYFREYLEPVSNDYLGEEKGKANEGGGGILSHSLSLKVGDSLSRSSCISLPHIKK